MHRILIKIPVPFGDGFLPIYSYGFMMMLAFVVGIALAHRRARRAGLDPEVVMDIGLYSVVCGIIGARLAFIITDMDTPRQLLEYVAIWHGGLTFQGGLFMALAVCIWYLRAHRLPAGRVADIFAPSIAVGLALGRIGCYLNGCCWGRICDHGFPLGVIFPVESSVHNQQLHAWETGGLITALEHAGYGSWIPGLPKNLPVPVHPTQLYTSVAMLCVFLAVLAIERLPRRFDGMVMLAFLMLYSMVRFLIEFVREDTPLYLQVGGFAGLRLGQILALITVVATAGVFVCLWRRAAPGGAGEAKEMQS